MIDDGIDLRESRESDLTFLVWLRRETVRSHLIKSGVIVDEAQELERVTYRLNCAQIIVRNGGDIGLLKVCRDRDPWELSQIQTVPEHQRVGIGTVLLQRLLAEAKTASVSVALLVLKANPATRLYDRLGFRVVDTRELVYAMLHEPA